MLIKKNSLYFENCATMSREDLDEFNKDFKCQLLNIFVTYQNPLTILSGFYSLKFIFSFFYDSMLKEVMHYYGSKQN